MHVCDVRYFDVIVSVYDDDVDVIVVPRDFCGSFSLSLYLRG